MKTLIILIAMLITLRGNSQSFKDQQSQLLLYNIGINAVIGGVSELITNPRHVTHTKAFLHGFQNGSIGGMVIGATKLTSGYLITNKINELVWATQFTHALGTSIVYNTSRGSKFLQYYNFDLLGLCRMQVDFSNKKIKPYINPFGIGAFAITSLTKGNEIDFKNTLITLTPCFTTTNTSSAFSTNLVSSIVLFKGITPASKSEALSHEFIHMLQYREYLNFNNIVLGTNKTYLNQTGFLKYINLDIPYFGGAYYLNNLSLGKKHYYYKNFFEFEAESFASGKYVKRNY